MAWAEVTRRLAEEWERQGQLLTWRQAQRLGADPKLMHQLVARGVIVRLHPGVYGSAGVGRDHLALTRAAILAATGSARGRPAGVTYAVASHGSAAWLQGLVDQRPSSVHITVAARHALRLEGVVVHRSSVPQIRRQAFHGVPCTPPARTLVDLAGAVTPVALVEAVDRALSRRLVRVEDLVAETRSAKGRRGSLRLRDCLNERGITGAPAPSVLESRMARLFVRYGLPPARAEYIAGPDGEYRLDYAYPRQMVATELYGYTWHHSPDQMARDLARQRRLTLSGWRILVFTWQDVTRHPGRVAAEISRALSIGPATGR